MKVLLINGSPNKEGCTYTALKEVADTLNHEGVETYIYHIGKGPIHGCVGCGGCKKLGKCVYGDDTLNDVIEIAKSSDGFVFGTPVYFASANGSLSAFLDRLFMAVPEMAYKPGAAVACARRAGTTGAIDQILKYFTIRNMPVVSSNYWPMVYGSTPEQAKMDQEGMQTMRGIGYNMAWLIKCINAGKENGIPMPTVEEKIKTNFI